MTGSFARGAPTVNSMLFKPMMRKSSSYHKKASSGDNMMRETVKSNTEKGTKSLTNNVGENDCWVPHDRTGIYYPKGHEKVMQDVPPGAAKDFGVHRFNS